MESRKQTRNQIYGRKHRRWRDILPDPTGKPCPRCGRPMYHEQGLDLGHVTPTALGGGNGPRRWEHSGCNRKAGSALGHARKRAKRGIPGDIRERAGQYTPGYSGDIRTEQW